MPAHCAAGGAAFSPAFADFVELCLRKEPAQRATAPQLRAHPWMQPLSASSEAEQADLLAADLRAAQRSLQRGAAQRAQEQAWSREAQEGFPSR